MFVYGNNMEWPNKKKDIEEGGAKILTITIITTATK